MSRLKIILTSVLIILFNLSINAQEISELKLEKKISILNDRVTMMFPLDAIKSESQGNIMGPKQNLDNESTIILTFGKSKLFVLANELFIKNSGKNILDYTENETAGKFINKYVKNDSSLVAVSSIPLKVDYSQKAVLLNNMIVELKDHSLIRLSCYINTDGIVKQSELSKLSERIFATIEAGTRNLKFEKRIVNYVTFNNKVEFKINVPENFAFYVDKGPDFDVIRILKIGVLGEVENSSLSIYLGDYPTLYYDEFRLNLKDSVITNGVFLGKEISWLNFEIKNNNIILREQQIQCLKISESIIIHVAMISNNSKSINSLDEIIRNIELVEIP